ncbi:single-pass membrane and coiled-coil domain-containing protein 4 [Dryobates pubescens]|nr:single-pass membrane and coiled-coil domain-containing protein 4 [Dryobates pubescens]
MVTHRVEVNVSMLKWRLVTSSNPRGSILGAALFNIFVSNLDSSIECALSNVGGGGRVQLAQLHIHPWAPFRGALLAPLRVISPTFSTASAEGRRRLPALRPSALTAELPSASGADTDRGRAASRRRQRSRGWGDRGEARGWRVPRRAAEGAPHSARAGPGGVSCAARLGRGRKEGGSCHVLCAEGSQPAPQPHVWRSGEVAGGKRGLYRSPVAAGSFPSLGCAGERPRPVLQQPIGKKELGKAFVMTRGTIQIILCECKYLAFASLLSTVPSFVRGLAMGCADVNEGKVLDAVYLDFSKAFDTVPYSILLDKVADHGFPAEPAPCRRRNSPALPFEAPWTTCCRPAPFACLLRRTKDPGRSMRQLRGKPKKETSKDKKERKQAMQEARQQITTVVLPTLAVVVLLIVLFVYVATRPNTTE